MTTAFILALIAALALASILFFALNYIRKLERDNARLARMWSYSETWGRELEHQIAQNGLDQLMAAALLAEAHKNSGVVYCRDCSRWADRTCAYFGAERSPFDFCSYAMKDKEADDGTWNGAAQRL